MGCMESPEKGSMSVLRWCRLWMYLYIAEMWINLVLQIFLVDVQRANYYLHLPVCEVEVELPVERHPECGGHEEGEVVRAGGRHLVTREAYRDGISDRS